MFPILRPPTRKRYSSSTWGKSRAYRDGWHEGTDWHDDKGAPAYAAASGVVSSVDLVDNSFAGKWLSIQHPEGVTSRYLHMTDIYVKKGDWVYQGQVIGTVGDTGTKSSADHVHFDLKLDPQYLPAWERQFGKPTTGFGRKMSEGVGVPTEPIMAGATYEKSTRKFSEAKGVRFYGNSLIDYAIVASIILVLLR